MTTHRRALREMAGQGRYPISSLHDFLAQLRVEFRRFRIVSVLNVAAYGLILLFIARFASRVFSGERQISPSRALVDLTLIVISAGAIAFTMYTCYRQNTFFTKWTRTFETLERKERRLLAHTKRSY